MRELVVPLGALRRTGELALAVLEGLPTMSVLVFDAELRYVLAGGTTLATHGREPESFIGGRLGDFVAPHVADRWTPAYEAALRGEHARFEYESEDGAHLYDVEVAPIESGGEVVGGLAITRDVTEPRRVQADLARSEREHSALAAHAGDVHTRTDANAVYLYVSPSSERVFGLPPEAMIGRSVMEFVHPDHHEAQRQARDALRDGAAELVLERPMRHGNNGWVWVESRLSAVRDEHGGLAGVQTSSRDISDRKAAETARQIADEQFRTAFDDAPIGVALVGTDGTWLRINEALCAMLGYSHEELQAIRFQDVTHPDDVEADVALVGEVLSGDRRGYQMEKRYIRKDRSEVWASLSVSLVRDASGEPLHFISHVQDISARKHLESELRRLATQDDLTGLHNRRHFERELARSLKLVQRYGEHAAVLLLDLDDFKSVNDTYGHAGGDELLRHAGGVLRDRLRETDLVARFGGDEFAILLRHTHAAAAERVAEVLRQELDARPATIDGNTVAARASIGVAALDAELDAGETMRVADQAMYRVKRSR